MHKKTNIETNAITILHVIREHPEILKRYFGIFNRNIYLSSLRLDSLFFDFENSLKIAIEHTSSYEDKNNTIIKYLESCYHKANPVYAAVSLNGKDFNNLFKLT